MIIVEDHDHFFYNCIHATVKQGHTVYRSLAIKIETKRQNRKYNLFSIIRYDFNPNRIGG